MLGDFYYGTLHGVGITTLARHLRQGALVLCYHNVVTGTEQTFGDAGLHLPLDRFEAQIAWLKYHYTIVPLRDLVARLGAGRAVRGLAALTFDDGYTGTVTLALPLLRRLGVPATLFVVGDAPGQRRVFWWDHPGIAATDSEAERRRRLQHLGGDRTAILANVDDAIPNVPETHLAADWSLLRGAAQSGIEIGAHTVTHRTLTRLDDEALRRELEGSREIIEDRTGIRPESLSYPYGIWDARVRDAAHRTGYRAAVTLDFGLNNPGIDACALRRVNVPCSISKAALAGWAAGVRPGRAPAA